MKKHSILFLTADPRNSGRRALMWEEQAIRTELQRSGQRAYFDFITQWAAAPLDLLRALRMRKPTVVHFSGHGGQDGLFFQSATGDARATSSATIAEPFDAVSPSVKLVFLSACYSEGLAQAFLAHVDCVVGTSSSIHEDAARTFAIGFYGALGALESVAAAYRLGIAALHAEGLPAIERPQLRVRDGVDVDRLILAAETAETPFRSHSLDARSPPKYFDLYLEGPKRPRGQPQPMDDSVAKAAASPTIHLNVWFPEHQGVEVALTVGVATQMRVNLAHGPRAGTLASERVSDGATKRFYEVEHVDVVAICPGADVWPLRARLPLPPDADAVASFEITPRRAGQLELLVILLIEGESIHQTKASIRASAPAGATTEVPR